MTVPDSAAMMYWPGLQIWQHFVLQILIAPKTKKLKIKNKNNFHKLDLGNL